MFLVLLITIGSMFTSFAQVSPEERQALIDLYNATDGDNWNNTLANNKTWFVNSSSSLVSDWYGVRVVNGKVTRITMPRNNLNGVLPNSIGDLIHLENLSLVDNETIGGDLPVGLYNLVNLTTLNLNHNSITGNLSSNISNLNKLSFLGLAQNQISGGIPLEIGTLDNLRNLNLADNNLIGSIPAEIGNLSKLELLFLAENMLAGEIPSNLGNLILLEDLDLSNTLISGAIPAELGLLQSLETLSIINAKLTGIIPSTLSQIPNLRLINLSNNEIEGTIPSSLNQLNNLRLLVLNDNKLTGELPVFLQNFSNLFFNIQNNEFVFSNLESEFANYQTALGNNNFRYAPQVKVDEVETLSVEENGTITLTSTTLTSNNNSYQWFKDGIAISGATSKDYVIENAALTNAGVYHFTATNSVIADLTIERNPITLEVTPVVDTCGVSEAEKQALIDLYNSTDGANWTNNTNWLTDAPVCDWSGVTVVDGRLVTLYFLNNNLVGNLPSSLENLINIKRLTITRNPGLIGDIPISIGNLNSLELIEFSSNNLTGEIPSQLGNINSLRTLSVFGNELTGPIPLELGNLNNLVKLSIGRNSLTGVIPPAISNLENLESLEFNSNQLTGPIPVEFGNLLNLVRLDLTRNKLSGSIPPEIGNLTKLEHLLLTSNELNGSIPASIGNLSRLKNLTLGSNDFTGEIPVNLSNLSNLSLLHLFRNKLTGGIDSGIGNLPNLSEFNVESNLLSGVVPSGFSTLTSSGIMKKLVLTRNSFVFQDFESEFPVYSSDLSFFSYQIQNKVDEIETIPVSPGGNITLSSTAMTSANNSYQWFKNNIAIPGATNKDLVITNASDADAGVYHFTANNSIVTDLTLTRNPITLEINCRVSPSERQALIDLYNATNGDSWTNTLANNKPWLVNDTTSSVCDWGGVTVMDGKITRLSVVNNKLSGEIPASFGDLVNLTFLNLGINQLTGQVPESIGNLVGLETLEMTRNQFTGGIPASIGNLTNLVYINFAINKLSEPLPDTFSNLVNLEIFSIERNAVTGTIPVSIGGMTSLNILNFGSNKMTGSIPSSVGNLTQLTQLNLFRNQLSGTIPSEIGNLTALTHLNLFSNLLTGTIPDLNGLSNLIFFNLYRNQLEGQIPEYLGSFSDLTTIGLSTNRLTGEIPASLGNLSNLQTLTLDGNLLTGSIPSEFGLLSELTLLNLYRNQLTGSIPVELGSLPKLQTLGLSTNQLSGSVPTNLGALGTSDVLNVLTLDRNSFVFSDFETEFPVYQNDLTTFSYLTQSKVDETETISVIENGTITLTSTALTSPNNSYQWFKDGVAIAGATSKDYVIAAASETDAGVYHFTATNSVVTDLTLERNPITLEVTPDLCGVSASEREALWQLYQSTNGQNWTNTQANNRPWDLNIPVCDWFGVTVVNGEVIGLNLENNVLQGNIPSSISNLLHLTTLNLGENDLTGEIPSSIGTLLELTTLSLDNNNLTGLIPPALGSLSNITVMDLSSNNLEGFIPIAFCNLSNATILNLSNNQLSGSIPKEIGILTKLVQLDLRFNSLSGTIPSDLVRLSNLEFLGLSNNQLSGFIPFTVRDTSRLETFVFENNNFIFSNFESKHPEYVQNLNTSYQYSPQAKTDAVETKMVTSGNSITLTTVLSSENNQYQWFKNDTLITGATGKDFVISNATPEDAGVYYFRAINTVITGLTLERHPISLNVEETCNVSALEREALVAIYNAMDGTNWANTQTNNQPWLINDPASQVCDWYGVTVINNQVVGLNLGNNNLSGAMANELGNLTNLKTLILSSNRISDNTLSLATALPLETLHIENNNLIFENIESSFQHHITSGASFTYAPQAKVDTQTTEVIVTGESITLTSTKLTSANNQYQWFKNGLPITGATNKDLVITSAAQEDTGMYFFEATNTIVTGLTLVREPIKIEVKPEGDTCGVSEAEKQALIDLYNSADGSNWTNKWDLTTPVCDWYGVVVQNGKVIRLSLARNALNGDIPGSIGNLVNLEILVLSSNELQGNIPLTLTNLVNLDTLFLDFNNLTGEIPTTIGELKKLKNLKLEFNRLEGSIPEGIQELSSLERIDLASNELIGSIPLGITQLVNLKSVRFFTNNLEGAIPNQIGNLVNLTELQLGNNDLTGRIPESLTQLVLLERFNIIGNNIIGEIPVDIGNLTLMKSLVLAQNELEGNIPTGISQLKDMTNLNIWSNNLSGKIPSEIVALTKLTNYSFYLNNFVFADFEDEFNVMQTQVGANFNYSPQAKVDEVEAKSVVSGQSITLTTTVLTSENNSYQWFKDGAAISGATSKDYVIENALDTDSGIYHFTATNSIVTGLTLERNPITLEVLASGTCDVSDEDRQALIEFYKTTGGDGWTNTTEENHSWLINNPDSKVCDWYGVTVSADYKILNIELPNNNVRGEIPAVLEVLDDLEVLDLAKNNVIGEIPTSLGNMPNLQVLNLRENVLVGALTEAIGNLTRLELLDLGENRLTSVIPLTIGDLQNLKYVDLSVNKLQGTIPDGLWSLIQLEIVKLQDNQLQGSISSSIGNLAQLQVFWVSNNRFSGLIPQTIILANTPNLYSIHLDNNSFSGDLPQLIPNLLLPNTSVQIDDNRFVFSDFESEHSQYRDGLINYKYIPQARVDRTETITVEIGGAARLFTSDLSSPNNTYRWFKDGVFFRETTEREFTIDNITEADLGTYYFTATNSTIEDLILERNRILLRLEDITNPPGNDEQSFCLSQKIPTVSDLISPIEGVPSVSWYESEIGGEPLAADYEIIEFNTFWAQSSANEPRVSLDVEVHNGITGFDVLDVDYQQFSIVSNAKVNDLEPKNQNIQWFETAAGGTPIVGLTDLEDGKSYFGQQGNNPCRFEVTVFIGVFEPDGDQTQAFCESDDSTITDLKARLTAEAEHTLLFYKEETGNIQYSLTDPLINGQDYYVSQRDNLGNESTRKRINVLIYVIPPATVNNTEQIFYGTDPVFISDLQAVGDNILWYDVPFGGIAYNSSDRLVNGQTYYAAQIDFNCNRTDDDCCMSTNRTEVRVSIVEELPPTLIGCERFRPQPGDRYVISGWVRENGMLAVDSRIVDFNEVSETFVALLNHLLKDKVLAGVKDEVHIPKVYVPDNRSFDILVPYIKNSADKNLTIYNFEYIKERQNNQGVSRTVGFSFALEPSPNALRLEYKTPFVRANNAIQNYRYPLLHNPTLSLDFKKAEFCTSGSQLCLTSSFAITGNNASGTINYTYSNANERNNDAGTALRNEFTKFTFALDPNYQVMEYANSLLSIEYGMVNEDGDLTPLESSTVEFRPYGAIIDGWQRISADFTIPLEATNMVIGLKSRIQDQASANLNVYFDDIRIHPFDGNMKTFVYDPITQRLQSELDENNYSTFYEYDQEGGLIRVKKETEKGVFTIQETRSGNSKLKLNNTQK